jgi:hypothetical protein
MGALCEDVFLELIGSWRKQAETAGERVAINLLRAASKAAKGNQLAPLDLSAFSFQAAKEACPRPRAE